MMRNFRIKFVLLFFLFYSPWLKAEGIDYKNSEYILSPAVQMLMGYHIRGGELYDYLDLGGTSFIVGFQNHIENSFFGTDLFNQHYSWVSSSSNDIQKSLQLDLFSFSFGPEWVLMQNNRHSLSVHLHPEVAFWLLSHSNRLIVKSPNKGLLLNLKAYAAWQIYWQSNWSSDVVMITHFNDPKLKYYYAEVLFGFGFSF